MARTIPFYITEEIRPDEERFNWRTYQYETIESNTSQRYFVDQLAGVTAADSVELYINSMGGSVKEAVGIYNVLRRCPAAVTAYIDGFAASAASVIAMAADKIIMPRNTCMMIHNAAWGTYGNPAQLRKSADDLEVLNKSVINSYVMHAGNRLPALELNRMLDAETWLTAEDCVKFGLADELAQDNADMTTAANQFAAAAATGAAAYAKAPEFLRQYLPQPAAKALGGDAGETPEQKPQGDPPVNNRRSLAGLMAKTILSLEENNEK